MMTSIFVWQLAWCCSSHPSPYEIHDIGRQASSLFSVIKNSLLRITSFFCLLSDLESKIRTHSRLHTSVTQKPARLREISSIPKAIHPMTSKLLSRRSSWLGASKHHICCFFACLWKLTNRQIKSVLSSSTKLECVKYHQNVVNFDGLGNSKV